MSAFLNISVLVLATMVLVLAGMVGYMYWQQNKTLQLVSSLSSFVSSHLVATEEEVPEPKPEPEDDRASVEEEQKVEVVEDVDDLQGKTSTELRELLSKKGIPFSKRDSKSVLLQLLKATA